MDSNSLSRETTASSVTASPRARLIGELGGACGDLGTLLPHMLGLIAVAGLAPAGVLVGFGLFLVASGTIFAIPLAVQPMKAVSAVVLAHGLDAGAVAATGLILGAVFLLLALSGAITRVARFIPQSVTAGLQLGLGLSMGWIGLKLMAEAPWLGGLTLLAVLALLRVRGCPAALVALVAAVAADSAFGSGAHVGQLDFSFTLPGLAWPSWEQFGRAFELAVLPQLPLTVANAIVITAVLARELLPERSGRATERNLCFSTGLGNLLLAPIGALPMCHGAGGLQAQFRFGARSGAAPILLGVVLLTLGLSLGTSALSLMAAIPAAAVGALLVFAGTDLAASRRLFNARLSCWGVIGVTALATVITDPFIGLVAGCALELLQRPLAALATRICRRSRG
jgi:predicted benzoate:H+ symporter BenE